MSKTTFILFAGFFIILLFFYHDTFYLLPLFILTTLFIFQNVNIKNRFRLNLFKIDKKYVFLFCLLGNYIRSKID